MWRVLVLVAGCGRIAFDPIETVCTMSAARTLDRVVPLGGLNDQNLHGLAIDGAGGLFVTGDYRLGADFGGGALPGFGGPDVFVAGLDEAGGYRWQHGYGGTIDDWGNIVRVDSQGHTIVAARFMTTTDFGSGPVVSNGQSDLILLNYSADGTLAWGSVYGSIGWDDAYALALDDADNIYIAGTLHGTVDYGGGALTSSAQPDALIASFTPEGTHRWSRAFGGPGEWDEAKGIVVEDGVVYVVGNFIGTVDFGVAVLTTPNIAADVFVLALDSATGTPLWVRQFGGVGVELPGELAYSARTLFIAGQFLGSAQFGSELYTEVASTDAFLLAISDTGDLRWSRAIGTAGYDSARAVTANDCAVAFGGFVEGQFDFGFGAIGGDGADGGFVAEYTIDGTPIWATTISGPRDDSTRSVMYAADGTLWAGGQFTGTVNFGGGPITASGVTDAWVARYR